MALYIQKDYQVVGVTGDVDESQAQLDLIAIADKDTGLGFSTFFPSNRTQVTYAGSTGHAPQLFLDKLVSLPATQNIVIVAARSNFVLNDGLNTPITAVGAVTWPAQSYGNNTNDCYVIYDISQNNGLGYCGARKKTGAAASDLRIRTEHYLYNQLDYAYRFVTSTALPTTPGICNPASDADKAAIDAENELRKQICNDFPETPFLRDSDDACVVNCPSGAKDGCKCCIIASLASGSPVSQEVSALRAVRDTFVRKTEVGFAFFNKLFYDYYGFSPQICTTMAGRPELAPLVLQGFVRPLIVALQLLQAYAFEDFTDTRLGQLFADHHPGREVRRYRPLPSETSAGLLGG